MTSFVAAAILVDFVKKSPRLSDSVLPLVSHLIAQLQEQITAQAAPWSPVIARDLQLLTTLQASG
jgi:hypothetical protein